MRVILFLLAIGALLLGGSIITEAEGAVHQIQAFIFYLIGAVLFSAAAVVDAIVTLPKRMAKATKSNTELKKL